MKITYSSVLDGKSAEYIQGWKDYGQDALGRPVAHPTGNSIGDRQWLTGHNDHRRYFEGHYTQKNA